MATYRMNKEKYDEDVAEFVRENSPVRTNDVVANFDREQALYTIRVLIDRGKVSYTLHWQLEWVA